MHSCPHQRSSIGGYEKVHFPSDRRWLNSESPPVAVLGDLDAEITALEAKLSKTHLIKQGMMQGNSSPGEFACYEGIPAHRMEAELARRVSCAGFAALPMPREAFWSSGAMTRARLSA